MMMSFSFKKAPLLLKGKGSIEQKEVQQDNGTILELEEVQLEMMDPYSGKPSSVKIKKPNKKNKPPQQAIRRSSRLKNHNCQDSCVKPPVQRSLLRKGKSSLPFEPEKKYGSIAMDQALMIFMKTGVEISPTLEKLLEDSVYEERPNTLIHQMVPLLEVGGIMF
jgi:hypothetical protein